jgi:hypothetical protein
LSARCGIFFPRFNELLARLADPRDPVLTDYGVPALVWTAILMFVCRLGARRQIHHRLNLPTVAAYLGRLACQALHRVPHGDTVADLVGVLLVEELAGLRTALVRSLIERRMLEGLRLLGTDYLITLDGTGHLALGDTPSKFTEGCLTQKLSDGRTFYYRYVLEAKLVARSSLALSVGTEFVENLRREGQSDDDYKQDCELKGAYRLLPRLKDHFPQLSICLLLDGLYANEPIFALCQKHHWHFIIVLKEGSLPSVYGEFHRLIPERPDQTRTHHTKDARQDIRWVNDIAYQGRTLHVLECVETPNDGSEPTTWLWVTNIPITRENAIPLANSGGRQRWRTENEGFNVQKNGGYAMEHAYAKDPTAAKNFYLLLQIAHTFVQLFERRVGGKRDIKARLGSLRNLAADLLEALRTGPLPPAEELEAFLATGIQVRLDTS